MSNLDTMLQSYLETALWSSNDYSDDSGEEPFDANYGLEDCAKEFVAASRTDCKAFLEIHEALIGSKYSQAGHDFWLTRNRHGAGFWDGDWEKEAGRVLTEASHAYGSVDLYLGDDGQIHGS